jgi:hypothetical protein
LFREFVVSSIASGAVDNEFQGLAGFDPRDLRFDMSE